MLTVKKCDNGVPLPEGSRGTFYTWDTFDEERWRTVTQHRDECDARIAARWMNEQPWLRLLVEQVNRGDCSHRAILEALLVAAQHKRSDQGGQ